MGLKTLPENRGGFKCHSLSFFRCHVSGYLLVSVCVFLFAHACVRADVCTRALRLHWLNETHSVSFVSFACAPTPNLALKDICHQRSLLFCHAS